MPRPDTEGRHTGDFSERLRSTSESLEKQWGLFYVKPGSLSSMMKNALTDFIICTKSDPRRFDSYDEILPRAFFLHYFSDKYTPLYSLEELANAIGSFIDYIKVNERDLLRYGGSANEFMLSPWLERVVGRLYPRPDRTLEWVRKLAFKGLKHTPSGSFSELLEDSLVLRRRMLKVKTAILSEVFDALRNNADDSLLDGVLKIITKEFESDEVRALFLIDSSYHRVCRVAIERIGKPFDIMGGGLLDTLELVNHCIVEIHSGPFCTAREKLSSLINGDLPRERHLSESSFHKLVDTPAAASIAEAIDSFETARENARSDSKTILTELSKSFEEDLQVRTLTGEYFKGSDKARRFTSEIKAVGIQLANRYRENGTIPAWSVGQRSDTSSLGNTGTPDEIFVHSADYRSVKLKGQLYTLSSREAELIQILHEAYEKGAPSLGSDYILNEMFGSDSEMKRLRDVFKDKTIFKALIITERKGTYRLNIG